MCGGGGHLLPPSPTADGKPWFWTFECVAICTPLPASGTQTGVPDLSAVAQGVRNAGTSHPSTFEPQ